MRYHVDCCTYGQIEQDYFLEWSLSTMQYHVDCCTYGQIEQDYFLEWSLRPSHIEDIFSRQNWPHNFVLKEILLTALTSNKRNKTVLFRLRAFHSVTILPYPMSVEVLVPELLVPTLSTTIMTYLLRIICTCRMITVTTVTNTFVKFRWYFNSL